MTGADGFLVLCAALAHTRKVARDSSYEGELGNGSTTSNGEPRCVGDTMTFPA